ncbi:VOC family protein [Ramlibacter sp. 2FC]|uniref:VOC family protein n=1 Tax=Ramlibacter sp. 2FC TaxID=2502188 RepID=UPI001BB1EB0C|nr:VOC family protein [Ramlibacter sp. 2FC]
MIEGLNHATVLAEDLERTLAFYGELLELHPGPRPELGVAGAWLYAGGRPVLHIVAGRALPPGRAGVIDHVAFTARGLAALKARLEAAAVPFTLRRQSEDGPWQLFCHDPNGARIELDFDAAETA